MGEDRAACSWTGPVKPRAPGQGNRHPRNKYCISRWKSCGLQTSARCHRAGRGFRIWHRAAARPPWESSGPADGSHPRPGCPCRPSAPKANQKQRTGRGWWHTSLCFIVGNPGTASAAPPPSASAPQQTPAPRPQPGAAGQGSRSEPRPQAGASPCRSGWRQSSSMGLLSS